MSLPQITLLMATYNGARHLPEQLASFAAQTGVALRVIASDDGSTDGTVALLQAWGEAHPLELRRGPALGFAANFLALLAASPEGTWVALSDQDDIWLPGKLARAQEALAALGPEALGLYCSRRLDWDPATDRKRVSQACPRGPGFGNALIENIAFGNTVLLTPAAARLAREVAEAAQGVPYHDWWLYLLITGAGGQVIHDAEPSLLYRQHGANLVGAETGLRARLAQEGRLPYAQRIARNLEALARVADRLTPEARHQLSRFTAARSASLPGRIAGMRGLGLYRQSWRDQLQFWGAVALGRV